MDEPVPGGRNQPDHWWVIPEDFQNLFVDTVLLIRIRCLLQAFVVPLDTLAVKRNGRPLLDEILHLPPAEWLRLVEDIWDSLGASTADVPVTEWHREELDQLLDDAGQRSSTD